MKINFTKNCTKSNKFTFFLTTIYKTLFNIFIGTVTNSYNNTNRITKNSSSKIFYTLIIKKEQFRTTIANIKSF